MTSLIPIELGTAVCGLADSLYLGAFPECERTSLEALHRFSEEGHVNYMAIWDDGFRGLVYTVEDDSLLFVLYLAVDPDNRGRGYGSSALEAVHDLAAGRRVFLNAEPPDEGADRDVRTIRISFYRDNGFSDSGKVTFSDGQRFLLLHRGGAVSMDEAAAFYRCTGVDMLFGTHPSGDVRTAP